MKFGPIPVSDAEDCILAHSLMSAEGRLKKGHVLTKADVENLVKDGVETVTVAQLEDGDVEENTAAERIANALTSSTLRAASPFTGRVNLYAKSSGIFLADRKNVNALNRITPSLTLACLHDGVFVEEGRMVATVKIIPFAVEEDYVSKADKLLAATDVLNLKPSRALKIGLIATRLESLKSSVMDKTVGVLKERLVPSKSELIAEIRVGHTDSEVAQAIGELELQCDLIVVFGASAITDLNDVIPTAIVKAGGQVDYFGMPVDPGNLLLLGSLNGKMVIGAPGCARSPAENGFDWVLQRVIAGLPVDETYISGLGVGGLLMEITARPQPREG